MISKIFRQTASKSISLVQKELISLQPMLYYQPSRPIFNFFKKDKSGTEVQKSTPKPDDKDPNQDPDAEAKEEEEEDDTFVDKHQYLELLKKKREKEEEEKERIKQHHEYHEQRETREYEVTVANVDYSRINDLNIPTTPSQDFKGLEELFYFIANLSIRLSEENIKKCLQGFLSLAEVISSKDLEKPQYLNFIEIVKKNVMAMSQNETLVLIARFGDLYVVNDPNFWQYLERKLYQRLDKMTTDEIISVLVNFSNQNEGSEDFYDRIEKYLAPHLKGFGIKELAAIALSFYQAKRGTVDFFIQLHVATMPNIKHARPIDLVRLSIVYALANLETATAFQVIEAQVLKKLDEFKRGEICALSEAFGFEHGSPEFNEKLEQKIRPGLADMEFIELMNVVQGFVYTYRGSKELFNELKSKLIAFLPKLSAIDVAKIAKAYNIMEINDKIFEYNLERHCINLLKDLENITPEEIYEIALTYNTTRAGTREIYKVLEYVIKVKLDEIAKNTEIVRGLHYMYTTSGLCSPKLIDSLILHV